MNSLPFFWAIIFGLLKEPEVQSSYIRLEEELQSLSSEKQMA